MTQNSSREGEPSAFAWIFGSVLGLLGAGAVVLGARLRRQAAPNEASRGGPRSPSSDS